MAAKASVLALLVSAVALTACGANNGNGDDVTTNDASPNPVCSYGVDAHNHCLPVTSKTSNTTPSANPSTSASTQRTKCERRHPHHPDRCRK
jgi:hypothetical protein